MPLEAVNYHSPNKKVIRFIGWVSIVTGLILLYLIDSKILDKEANFVVFFLIGGIFFLSFFTCFMIAFHKSIGTWLLTIGYLIAILFLSYYSYNKHTTLTKEEPVNTLVKKPSNRDNTSSNTTTHKQANFINQELYHKRLKEYPDFPIYQIILKNFSPSYSSNIKNYLTSYVTNDINAVIDIYPNYDNKDYGFILIANINLNFELLITRLKKIGNIQLINYQDNSIRLNITPHHMQNIQFNNLKNKSSELYFTECLKLLANINPLVQLKGLEFLRDCKNRFLHAEIVAKIIEIIQDHPQKNVRLEAIKTLHVWSKNSIQTKEKIINHLRNRVTREQPISAEMLSYLIKNPTGSSAEYIAVGKSFLANHQQNLDTFLAFKKNLEPALIAVGDQLTKEHISAVLYYIEKYGSKKSLFILYYLDSIASREQKIKLNKIIDKLIK